MNGRKAKQFRRIGKGLTTHEKKLYNSLPHVEKGILNTLYRQIIENNKDVLKSQGVPPKKPNPQIGKLDASGLNHKDRRVAASHAQRLTRAKRIRNAQVREKQKRERLLSGSRS